MVIFMKRSKKIILSTTIFLLFGLWEGQRLYHNYYNRHTDKYEYKNTEQIITESDNDIQSTEIITEIEFDDKKNNETDTVNNDDNDIKENNDNSIDNTNINKKSKDKKDNNTKETSVKKETTNNGDSNIQANMGNQQQEPKEQQTLENENNLVPQVQIDEETKSPVDANINQPTGSKDEKNVTQPPVQTNTDKPEVTTERQKIWHEPVYEKVWVVDDPGGDVTNYEAHTVCYQCGFDFSANHYTQSDIAIHQDTYGCWSYGTEMVACGTTHYEPIGHYEKKLIQEGYWE